MQGQASGVNLKLTEGTEPGCVLRVVIPKPINAWYGVSRVSRNPEGRLWEGRPALAACDPMMAVGAIG